MTKHGVRYFQMLVLMSACLFMGCANDQSGNVVQSPQGVATFDFQQMFQNYSDNILLPAYSKVVGDHAAFDMSLTEFCEAPGTAQTFSNDVQNSYKTLMTEWQRVELMQVGILQANDNALRHAIHPFNAPNARFSACLVDQSVAQLAANPNLVVSDRPLGARGLWALEYLAFSTQLTHNCPSQVTETQGWNDLPAAERLSQRCDYALSLSDNISQSLTELQQAWAPDGANYRETFINPDNAAIHLKQLSDALFYVEKETKDAKLGVPLGLKKPGCAQTACANLLESPFADISRANVQTNLQALQLMLVGGTGLGLDDLLASLDAAHVATRLDTLIDEALAVVALDQAAFVEQLSQLQASGDASICQNAQANPDTAGGVPVCRLHGLLKRITDTLRIDFVTAINVDLPERAGGDGD